MKVKRMREEKAARAKERWMKAESAAAGKRTRDKRQLAAAIKIQVMRTRQGRAERYDSDTTRSRLYCNLADSGSWCSIQTW